MGKLIFLSEGIFTDNLSFGTGFGGFRRGSGSISLFVATVEAINATGGVNQLLFSGEKWMTIRADFDVQIIFAR